MTTSDMQMQDLLDSLTWAVLNDQEEIKTTRETEDFVELIHQLKETLAAQPPSTAFVQELKQQLIHQEAGLLKRLGYTPGHVQLAAGVALVAGFMLIIRRRIIGEDEPDEPADIPALQR